jgi:hypothetical protein
MLCLSHVQGKIIDKVGQYRLAVWSNVVFVTCTRGDNRQGRAISSCNVVRCCGPHCKTILSYLVDYLPLYMWQTQHLTTLQDDIVLPCQLSPLVHVTNTTSDHTHCKMILSYLVDYLPLYMWETTSDHTHCKTILSYLVDYLPLYMWETTSDHTARRYCSILSFISPCTCDNHNIWPQCKTILSYLVDYLPLYMWQTQHLTTLQDDIVLLCRLSPLIHVTNTTSDHTARQYCPTLSIISPCTCEKQHLTTLQDNIVLQCGQMLCLSHV